MRAQPSVFVASFLALLIGCPPVDPPPPPPPPPAVDPGSLVAVSMSSQVGVLLDDFPAAMRDRVADELLTAPADFWIERARRQLRMTAVRLVYRKYYFDEAEQDLKGALPLPPEERWTITPATSAGVRTTVEGHDLVLMDYEFSGTLLSDVDSPGVSEPLLADIGGIWEEPFTFPLDPTLLLQRTGFACMSEDQFPPDSVDAEDAFRFYDDTCEAELPGFQVCHFAEPLPTVSCVEALDAAIGRVDTALRFERLPWDDAVADAARFGELTEGTPDLKVLTTGEGLNDNRIIYKYIPAGDCAVADGCVGAPGWRRLLIFDSHDHNIGSEPLHIGEVDYFIEGLGGDLIENNAYELSSCHNHYHFQFYGDFSFGSGGSETVQKNGFCIESTDRLSNNETSPLHTAYECDVQGVDPGWGDLYGSSLVCNWIDITDLDTSAGPVTDELTFHSNPDGFLCEGDLVLDDNGDATFEATEFTTAEGLPVNRPVCNQTPGTEDNDIGTVSVTVPQRGGFVSQTCVGDQNVGPLRNCGFAVDPNFIACTPQAETTLTCTNADPTKPQVVRLCDTSAVLGDAMDCAFEDARANVVLAAASTTVTFTCPGNRDPSEPGGEVAVFSAPALVSDGAAAVSCAP